MFIFLRKKTYYLEYLDETENRIRRISTKCKTKQGALKFLTEFRDKIISRGQCKFITIKDFKNEYLQYLSKGHSKEYNRHSNEILSWLITSLDEKLPLYKIQASQLERLLLEKFSSAPHRAWESYRILKSVFNNAIRWNYLETNPTDKIKLPKLPKSLPIFINEQELNRIIEQEPDNDKRDIYILAFHTGMRLGEILNLQWNAVDFSQREIRVQNTDTFKTKSRKDRVIPMNDKLFSVLRERVPQIFFLHNPEPVFTNKKSNKYFDKEVSWSFKIALRKAGLDDRIHFHTLRHSFASNLAQRGVSLYLIKELMGHEDYSTTQIYSHLQIDDLKQAVKVLES